MAEEPRASDDWVSPDLSERVALVAGATRGAGRGVVAWDRLGRFVLLHPCLVLTGVLWAILALFFPTERPGVEIDLGRICEVSGWVRSSLRRLDDRIQFDLQPEQTLQGDRHVQVPGRIQVYFPAPAEGIPEL